jgi:hypothetical protein
MNTNTEKCPNGIENYLETHFEIVQAITIEYMKDEPTGRVQEAHDANGHGGLYMLAEELTDKFEQQYKNVKWGEDLDWFDTLEIFIKKELY